MSGRFGVMGWLGLAVVAFAIAVALAAPWLAQHDPLAITPRDRFLPPSAMYLMGTDHLGRDLFARVLYGARTALTVAFGATALALIIGVILGLVAGYGHRWTDNVLLFCFDVLKSFPSVMLALVFFTLIGPGLAIIVIVVVLTATPVYARLIRTQTLALKDREFVEAARAAGAGGIHVAIWHILPNVIGTALIVASMEIPVVIAIEAGLSFLGVGLPPPAPSWGTILSDGFANIRNSMWIVVAGGLPVVITTLGFTFLGEALNDAFDPRRGMR